MMQASGIENIFSVEELRRTRDVVAPELIRLVTERPDVVVLSADMGPVVAELRERFPQRYFEFGIAEANTMSVAAGLAASGLTPYVVALAPFGAVKCAEQIRTDIAYNQLPVRIVARLSGIGMSFFGPSHHSVEDIAICRSIANLTVVAPSDAASTMALIRSTVDWPGPVFIRVSAGIDQEVHATVPEIARGRFVPVRDGSDATVIATGTGVAASLAAARDLEIEGISVAVLDAAYLKPLDEEAVVVAMERTGAILTVEEHSVVGGLGTAVADTLMRHGARGRFMVHGLPDDELAVSTPAALLHLYGITAAGVADKVRELLSVGERNA